MAQEYTPTATPQKSASIGVDLGGSHIRIGTVDHTGSVLNFRREPYTEQAKEDSWALAGQIIATVRNMLDEHGSDLPLKVLGVAFPGPVNQITNRVLSLSHLPSLAQSDLYEE